MTRALPCPSQDPLWAGGRTGSSSTSWSNEATNDVESTFICRPGSPTIFMKTGACNEGALGGMDWVSKSEWSQEASGRS